MKFHKKIEFICPKYNEIKSQITRNINKQLPPNITKFDVFLDESKYYKTIKNVNYMITKNLNLKIFQSPFQVFISIIYIKDLDSFCTIFSILKKKEQTIHEMLFKEIN